MKLMKSNLLLCTLIVSSGALAAEPMEGSVAQRALKVVDRDRDGRLTLAEYLPLDVQARHHGAEHFEKGDANGDGVLDVSELAATLHKQTWFAILAEGVEACFARIDADQDGKLIAKEYRKISRMGGHAEQHFRGADADKDGFLDLKEFGDHAESKLLSAANPKKKNR